MTNALPSFRLSGFQEPFLLLISSNLSGTWSIPASPLKTNLPKVAKDSTLLHIRDLCVLISLELSASLAQQTLHPPWNLLFSHSHPLLDSSYFPTYFFPVYFSVSCSLIPSLKVRVPQVTILPLLVSIYPHPRFPSALNSPHKWWFTSIFYLLSGALDYTLSCLLDFLLENIPCAWSLTCLNRGPFSAHPYLSTGLLHIRGLFSIILLSEQAWLNLMLFYVN